MKFRWNRTYVEFGYMNKITNRFLAMQAFRLLGKRTLKRVYVYCARGVYEVAAFIHVNEIIALLVNG